MAKTTVNYCIDVLILLFLRLEWNEGISELVFRLK